MSMALRVDKGVETLLFAVAPLVWVGGTLVAIGAAGHLTSLASNVRHRRRPLEVLHAFLFVSAAFLVAAIVLAGLAGAASVATTTRTRFVTAEVVALLAWIALAVVGHVHRIVPFIGYRVLRAQGITTGPSGRRSLRRWTRQASPAASASPTRSPGTRRSAGCVRLM